MKQKQIIEKLKEGGYIEGGFIGYTPKRLLLFENGKDTWNDWLTPKSFEALKKKITLVKEVKNKCTINGIGGRLTNCETWIFKIFENEK